MYFKNFYIVCRRLSEIKKNILLEQLFIKTTNQHMHVVDYGNHITGRNTFLIYEQTSSYGS